DAQRSLLAVDLRVELHHVRGVATVGIGVGHDLGTLSDPDLRQLRLGDIDLAPQVVEVGHADQVAGAGEPAGCRDLADLLVLGEDDAAARRTERGVFERDTRLRELRLRGADPRRRRVGLGTPDVHLLPRDDPDAQALGALALLVREVGLGLRQLYVGLRARDRGAVLPVVDLDQRVALLHVI